jgi:hypothetical protein
MLTRFTDTPDKNVVLISGVPLNRVGTPGGICGSHPFYRLAESQLHYWNVASRRRRQIGPVKKIQLTNP